MPPEPTTTALAIRGGTVIDATGERTADVVVRDGRVVEVAASVDPPAGARVLDASGCIVAPGLVDLHTHLREPGREEAETIETGARAAVLGGYTAVVAMPNTEPAIDDAATVRQILELGAEAACDVRCAGAITVGRQGRALTPMAEMAALGVRLFTDDGTGVQDGRVMRAALEYAGALGVTLAQHCEDAGLAGGGCMHEGAWSSRLGLPGQPAAAEEVMVARDLSLCALTGTTMHFLHLSTAGSVDAVRRAKASGLPVTAEAAPHHFTLTDEACAGYDTRFKVNPPLRLGSDVEAVKAGLADGTLDAVATDHAPHTQEAKEEPFADAPPGMLGLDAALSLSLSELSLGGPGLPMARVLALLSWQPARIAGLDGSHGRPVAAGEPANLCVFDPDERWVLDPARSGSRSRNSPYAGRKMTGKVRHTVVAGVAVVEAGEVTR